MLLSELLSDFKKNHILKIENEQPFERFMRATSESTDKACIFVAEKRYIRNIPSNVTMIITTEDIAETLDKSEIGLCISDDPKTTYFNGVEAFNQKKLSVKKPTQIGKGCEISELAYIAKDNVTIGNNVIIEPFATIYENVIIGDNCIIRSGARLGVEDYNFYRNGNELIHLTHAGSLILGNNVEVGNNSAIGKALYYGDKTVIGDFCKMAFACGVGHDVQLEDHVMIFAGTMVGGFSKVGSNSQIKMNCTIKNGTKIGKNVTVNMASCVIRNIQDNESVFGNPAKKMITPKP